MQVRSFLFHESGALGELLHEGGPLAFDLFDVEPVLGPLVPLLLQQVLASLATFELSFPLILNTVHLLDLRDKDSDIDIIRNFKRKTFQFMACLLHSLFECLHLLGQSGAKLVHDVIVDLVILVVHLGLYGSKANLKATKENKVIRCLEGLSAGSDLAEQLVPLVNLIT